MLIQGLRPFHVSQICSKEWKEQRQSVELLNFCSHTNANLKKDDFVMTSLVRHEKLPILLHELLVMDVWRRRVLPKVATDVMESPSGVYLYCNYELILLNFLECLLYFEEAVVSLEDSVLELLDYCWRQVNMYLAEGSAKIAAVPSESKSAAEVFSSQQWQMQSSRAMTCVSLLWFIVDRLGSLPMAAMNAVLLKNDLLVGFSDVLIAQPWQRRANGVYHKFVNGKFDIVDDALRVCVPEAHSWFAIHKLLCDRECRRKYPYTTYKKEAILRIKRFLNDTLVDQIPALVDVQRALEELSFLEPPSGTEEKFKSTLIIEPVAQFLEAIDRGDWDGEARAMSRMLKDPTERMEDARRLGFIFDQMMDLDA